MNRSKSTLIALLLSSFALAGSAVAQTGATDSSTYGGSSRDSGSAVDQSSPSSSDSSTTDQTKKRRSNRSKRSTGSEGVSGSTRERNMDSDTMRGTGSSTDTTTPSGNTGGSSGSSSGGSYGQ